MTGRTVEKGGQLFTVYDRLPQKPKLALDEWKDDVRYNWADEQSFAVVNMGAPVGAMIEVMGDGPLPQLYARDEFRLHFEGSPAPTVCRGWAPVPFPEQAKGCFIEDFEMHLMGVHWRPQGTDVWYPFTEPRPSLTVAGRDPDFDV